MYLKKRIAILLAVVMTIGCCFTVYADDPKPTSGSTTGQGDVYNHVDMEVITADLPTIPAKNPFDFVVDPERLVNQADGKLGTGVGVTANDDGVYFYNSTIIGPSSNKVQVSSNSSVSIDVVAQVTLDEQGENDILLVKDETELAAATEPALLLKLDVSGNDAAISYNGTTRASASVNGVSENFIFVPVSGNDPGPERIGQFTYRVKDGTSPGEDDLKPWNEADIHLVGKANQATVPSTGLTVPDIKITWFFKKSGDPDPSGPYLTVTDTGLITASELTAEKNAKSAHALSLTRQDGQVFWLDEDTAGAWGLDNWSSSTGGTLTKQISSVWLNTVKGQTITITLYLTDDTTKTASVRIPNS